MKRFRIEARFQICDTDGLIGDFDTLEEVRDYIEANPPTADLAEELVQNWGIVAVHYVVLDCDDEGRSKVIRTIEEFEAWEDEEVLSET